MNNTQKEKFFKKIHAKSIVDKNGCLIWQGQIKNGACRMGYTINGKRKIIDIHRFIFLYHNPDRQITHSEKCVRTCQNPKCNEITHLRVISKSIIPSREQIWKRLLKHGKRNENGCLIWQGSRHGPGNYGQSGIKGYHGGVHKISFWVHNKQYDTIQDIPKMNGDVHLSIRHICNDSLCFEPTHLVLGEMYENSYDDKIIAGTLARGTKNPRCTITEELARKIKLSKRNINEKGYKSQSKRAKKFGVSKSIVTSIDSGKTWAWLPDRDGNTSSKTRMKNRIYRKTVKERVWTESMWKEADKKLLSMSKRDTENNEFMGTPCILWTGYSRNGYGETTIFGKNFFAHVLACCIKNNMERPEGLAVRHLCGSSLCINKDHLEFGTQTENGHDMIKHGRGNIKLDFEKAAQIRKLYKTGKYNTAELGKKYGVTSASIRNIVSNKTWIKHSNLPYKNSGSKSNAHSKKQPTKTPSVTKSTSPTKSNPHHKKSSSSKSTSPKKSSNNKSTSSSATKSISLITSPKKCSIKSHTRCPK